MFMIQSSKTSHRIELHTNKLKFKIGISLDLF